MALTAPNPLPPKLPLKEHIDRSKGETYEDLPAAEREVYDTYWAEYHRRKDPSQPGVAQEALDCAAWCREQGMSESDADNEFGYSMSRAINPAKKEEERIVRELGSKPSKDIEPNPAVALVVKDVQAAKGIPEFVPEPDPEPNPEPGPE